MECKGILPPDPDLVDVGRDFDIRSRQNNPSCVPIIELPFGLPPGVTPQPKRDLEELLSHPESLPIYTNDRVQRFIPGELQTANFFGLQLHPPRTTLEVQRDLATGKVTGFKESTSRISGSTASNSVSRQRLPCSPKEALMGSNTNLPFLPAHIQRGNVEPKSSPNLPWNTAGPMLNVPPGFTKGHLFHNTSNKALTTSALESVLQSIRTEHWLSASNEPSSELADTVPSDTVAKDEHLLPEVDTLVSEVNVFLDKKEFQNNVLMITTEAEPLKNKSLEWAVLVPLHEQLSNFRELVPDMAKDWDFELDLFQKHAILNLEKNNDVFVAAHTSAGKTVVAEYAIALTLRHSTKVIYTSPVKALSNQKYREFKKTFGDVGLLTGDIQINDKASCLIMTTEILRSMLYRGAETIRELEWVIFDEVHYINDPERGVVWEEVLIMLPETVKLVMLSATVSNVEDLADWIGRTKKRRIFVMSTAKRPIPLEHYLYTGSVGKTQNEKFLLLDSNGRFLERNYNLAKEAKAERTSHSQKHFGPKGTRHNVSIHQEKNIYQGLLGHLKKEDKLPVICFTLSRKRCKQNAELLSSLDLIDQTEKSEIHKFFKNSTAVLKPVDQKLPQVRSMAGYLKRGIGVHHSGVLPILKEVVEMLFQKGLIKVLFATETFAMGVNMPARSVVFDSTRKHDGQDFRDLIPSEYIQMAGRAGRRGLDTTGTVVILCKGEVPDACDLKKMMMGKPQNIESRFRITYSMVLNLHRARELKMEEVLRCSFFEAGKQRSKGTQKEELKAQIAALSEVQTLQCYCCMLDDSLSTYFDVLQKHEDNRKHFINCLFSSKSGSKYFVVGRIVFLNVNEHPNVPGLILNVSLSKESLTVMTLMKASKHKPGVNLKLTPFSPGATVTPCSKKDFSVFEDVSLDQVTCITSTVLSVSKKKIQKGRQDPSDLGNVFLPDFASKVTDKPSDLKWFQPEDIPEANLKQILEDILQWENQLKTLPCVSCPQFSDHFNTKLKHLEMQQSINNIKQSLADTTLLLQPSYQSCLEVLKVLKYIDSQDILTMKGRVACELSLYQLLLTELLIESVLSKATPAECAALLSCIVFQEKGKESELLTPALKEGIEEIKKVAEYIERIQWNCGLHQDPDFQILDNLRFGLTHAVYQWAKGVSFADIAEYTDVEEGILVRAIQRLVEVLKDIRNAAHIIGNDALKQKMEEASQAIKRDIVFTASLYTKE